MNNILTTFPSSVKTRLDKDQLVYWHSLRKKEHFFISLHLFADKLADYGIDKKTFFDIFGTDTFEKNLSDCGSWLEWNYYPKSDKVKLQKGNFCKKDKLCPACAVRRAYKQQVKFLKGFEVDGDLSDYDWYYIVIPVKHSIEDSFMTVFNKIVDIRSKIMQSMRDKKRSKGNNFWSVFTGGMSSIETTKTKNGWNVHINLLINAPRGSRIKIKTITNSRGQKSRQSPDLVKFLQKTADSKMHNIQKLDFTEKEKIQEACVEVLKYSLKFSTLSDEDLIYIYLKTYRKRLFTTFGNLRGLDLENTPLEGDIINGEDFFRIIFRRVKHGYNFHTLTYQEGYL